MSGETVGQVKVAGQTVGIIGLEEILAEVRDGFPDAPEEVIGREILARVKQRNYVAPRAEERYREALVRAYRRYAGHEAESAESYTGVEVVLLGTGCMVCDRLGQTVMEVLAELALPAEMTHVTDAGAIGRYGVMGTPALVINGEVKCVGREPSAAELRTWLREAQAKANATGG